MKNSLLSGFKIWTTFCKVNTGLALGSGDEADVAVSSPRVGAGRGGGASRRAASRLACLVTALLVVLPARQPCRPTGSPRPTSRRG